MKENIIEKLVESDNELKDLHKQLESIRKTSLMYKKFDIFIFISISLILNAFINIILNAIKTWIIELPLRHGWYSIDHYPNIWYFISLIFSFIMTLFSLIIIFYTLKRLFNINKRKKIILLIISYILIILLVIIYKLFTN